MMNYIWSLLLLFSCAYAFISGNMDSFGHALINSSSDAVSFVIGLAGIMAMWSGLMEIAERSGLILKLSSALKPLTDFLFPRQKDPEILSCILMSFMSNIFGAGNSSTVFALRTMEKLDAQNNHNTLASDDMCMFAVVNMAFAPLIPVVTLQLRENLGSSAPFSTVLPSLITSALTILFSIIICKFMERAR